MKNTLLDAILEREKEGDNLDSDFHILAATLATKVLIKFKNIDDAEKYLDEIIKEAKDIVEKRFSGVY